MGAVAASVALDGADGAAEVAGAVADVQIVVALEEVEVLCVAVVLPCVARPVVAELAGIAEQVAAALAGGGQKDARARETAPPAHHVAVHSVRGHPRPVAFVVTQVVQLIVGRNPPAAAPVDMRRVVRRGEDVVLRNPPLGFQFAVFHVEARRVPRQEGEIVRRTVVRHPGVAHATAAHRVAPPEIEAVFPRLFRSDIRLRPIRPVRPELNLAVHHHFLADAVKAGRGGGGGGILDGELAVGSHEAEADRFAPRRMGAQDVRPVQIVAGARRSRPANGHAAIGGDLDARQARRRRYQTGGCGKEEGGKSESANTMEREHGISFLGLGEKTFSGHLAKIIQNPFFHYGVCPLYSTSNQCNNTIVLK